MCEARSDEHGSAVLLLPAGVLVVLMLSAIAVDAAIAFLGERELADLAAAAANDAATVALDDDAFYGCGMLRIDDLEAHAVARAVAAARSSDAVTVAALDVVVRNDISPPEVEVTASGTVRLPFTPTVPGRGRTRPVRARAIAIPQPFGEGDVITRC